MKKHSNTLFGCRCRCGRRLYIVSNKSKINTLEKNLSSKSSSPTSEVIQTSNFLQERIEQISLSTISKWPLKHQHRMQDNFFKQQQNINKKNINLLLLLATTTTINRLFRLQPHTANCNFDETDSVRKSKQTYSHLQAIHTYTCMSYNLVCSVLSNLTHFAKTYRSLKPSHHFVCFEAVQLYRPRIIFTELFLLRFSVLKCIFSLFF